LDIKLYVKGKLTSVDGKDLDPTDFTAVTNNFLHSLFSQCSIALNGVNITPAADLYYYRVYLETLLTYGTDAANTHLTNAYWYIDDGDLGLTILQLPMPKTKASSRGGTDRNTAT
jgi:hypothetical protein